MKARSAKRAAERPARDACRAAVLDRDRGCVAEGMAGVPHGWIPDRAQLEVNELKRGSGVRSEIYLDPEWCIALCPMAHDWVTEHPLEAKRRGLQLPAWCDEEYLPQAVEVRQSWRAGTAVDPPWSA